MTQPGRISKIYVKVIRPFNNFERMLVKESEGMTLFSV